MTRTPTHSGERLVYVQQYGVFWSLSLDQARDLLDAIKLGRPWHLDAFGTPLASRPAGFSVDRDSGLCYSGRHIYWPMPCDWSYGDEDWILANAEVSDAIADRSAARLETAGGGA